MNDMHSTIKFTRRDNVCEKTFFINANKLDTGELCKMNNYSIFFKHFYILCNF